jgi:hypothetical protein
MKKIIFLCFFVNLLFAPLYAAASENLTPKYPNCVHQNKYFFPSKYYSFSKKYPAPSYRWVDKVKQDDQIVSGSGMEQVDGSKMYSWIAMYKIDITNDGICDWFVDSSVPHSTGGGRSSANVIYVGGINNWHRIGFEVDYLRPDERGYSKNERNLRKFFYGEDPLIVRDSVKKINYIILAYHKQHTENVMRPGYRIYLWDSKSKSLLKLDKWEPDSAAAAVYSFFKLNGASSVLNRNIHSTNSANIVKFNIEIEQLELRELCEPSALQRAIDFPASYEAVSPYIKLNCFKR